MKNLMRIASEIFFKGKKGIGWRLLATIIIAFVAAGVAIFILWEWLGKFV